MHALNERLFLILNASDHPIGPLVAFANFVAADVIFSALLVLAGLWVWGNSDKRAALLATALATLLAIGLNQALGLLWFEPRPFMIGLGHTLAAHVPENSFPSDHATFMFSVGLGLLATGASRPWGIVVSVAGFAVAWARVYLGLHFPVDMMSSLLVAGTCSLGALMLQHPIARYVMPLGNSIYDRVLDLVGLPRALFPRTKQAK